MLFFSGNIKWKMAVRIVHKKLIKRKQNGTKTLLYKHISNPERLRNKLHQRLLQNIPLTKYY